MNPSCSEDDIKQWLKSALSKEKLSDFSVKVLGNSEKGEGYLGDIIFVSVSETKATGPKEYNFVLKCSKRSEAVRDNFPVQETFKNEIYLYSQVFPAFTKFQQSKGLVEIFNSTPQYYGNFIGDNTEVLVLENMKMLGYSLHDRKKPQTINHINLVLGEYAKWHAISAAMQDQHSEEFLHLANGVRDMWESFSKCMDLDKFLGSPIDEVYDLVENHISEEGKSKLRNLRGQVLFIMNELIYDRKYFSVVTHGDCWNNNFLFKYEESHSHRPKGVAMLDWQAAKFSNPVTDLSYFLYSCISSDDLKTFDDVLKMYYKSFCSHVTKLGSDPEKIYPFVQFLSDWKVFAKFGIMMALLAIKLAVCDQDEVADFTETIESGSDVSNIFLYDVKNKDLFKSRVLCIIEHSLEHGFI